MSEGLPYLKLAMTPAANIVTQESSSIQHRHLTKSQMHCNNHNVSNTIVVPKKFTSIFNKVESLINKMNYDKQQHHHQQQKRLQQCYTQHNQIENFTIQTDNINDATAAAFPAPASAPLRSHKDDTYNNSLDSLNNLSEVESLEPNESTRKEQQQKNNSFNYNRNNRNNNNENKNENSNNNNHNYHNNNEHENYLLPSSDIYTDSDDAEIAHIIGTTAAQVHRHFELDQLTDETIREFNEQCSSLSHDSDFYNSWKNEDELITMQQHQKDTTLTQQLEQQPNNLKECYKKQRNNHQTVTNTNNNNNIGADNNSNNEFREMELSSDWLNDNNNDCILTLPPVTPIQQIFHNITQTSKGCTNEEQQQLGNDNNEMTTTMTSINSTMMMMTPAQQSGYTFNCNNSNNNVNNNISTNIGKVRRSSVVSGGGSIGHMETILEEPSECKISVKEILARFETMNKSEMVSKASTLSSGVRAAAQTLNVPIERLESRQSNNRDTPSTTAFNNNNFNNINDNHNNISTNPATQNIRSSPITYDGESHNHVPHQHKQQQLRDRELDYEHEQRLRNVLHENVSGATPIDSQHHHHQQYNNVHMYGVYSGGGSAGVGTGTGPGDDTSHHHYNSQVIGNEENGDHYHYDREREHRHPHQYPKQLSYLHTGRKISNNQTHSTITTGTGTGTERQTHESLDSVALVMDNHGGRSIVGANSVDPFNMTGSPSVTRYSLLEFAMQHFRNDKMNIDPRAPHSRDPNRYYADLVKWQGTPLRTPLLRLPNDLTPLALECFDCILRYSGDVVMEMELTEVKCVYTVLMHCHKYLALRDEVYCQLMKQTTANRSPSPDSSQRSWRLLSILAAYFGCSDALRPYLMEHLTAAASDRRRSCHGTAAVCLTNLRKTARCGGRKNVPSVEEVTAVSAGRSARRQIYRLPGGAERVVNTRCSTVVADVISELCALLGIESEIEQQEFSLYCIVQGDAFTMPLAADEYILDVTTELLKSGQPFYLIFCRSVWHFPLKRDPPPTQLYVEVLFNQVAPDYLEGLLLELPGNGIPLPDTVKDMARIAALLHRAADLSHMPAMKEIKFLLPKPALGVREIRPAQWVGLVQSAWPQIAHLNPGQVKAQFLNVLSTWPLFGSSFFAVKRIWTEEGPQIDESSIWRDLILALNRRGVLFLDPNTHETLQHWPFMEVISTRKVRSENGALFLDMKVGNLMQQRVIRVQTEQAHEISRLVRQYITMAQISQRGDK